jgi:hypothetical protein
MSDDKIGTKDPWVEECVPHAFPNGVPLGDTLRGQLLAFLAQASQRPLKPTELSKIASDLTQSCLGSDTIASDATQQN